MTQASEEANNAENQNAKSIVIIGCFGRPVGVRGFLKLNSYTDPKENIFQFLPWQVKKNNAWQEAQIENFNDERVKIAGINDRELAATFTNCLIGVARSKLPSLPKHEYYWVDLIGLKVINKENVNFGTVSQVFATGANDILVVDNNSGTKKQQRLIPYLKHVILSVDLAKKLITVDWDADF